MIYLFLALILVTALSLTLALTRVKVFGDLRPIVVAVASAGIFNVLLSYAFVSMHVIKFDPELLSGIGATGVPLEQLLLCYLLPYGFLIIYCYLNASHPLTKSDRYSLSISNVLMGLSIAMIFFAYSKGLAVVTFSLMLLILFFVEYKSKLRFMSKFYRSYAVALIFFLLIFIPIHYYAIYSYGKDQTIELRLAYIPFEAFFCFLTMGLLTVSIYESFKRRV